jgi:hypothetical protein
MSDLSMTAEAERPTRLEEEHNMHGPPLTPEEALAAVARRVQRLEAQGLGRDQALRLTAAETGVDLEKVRWSVDRASLGASAQIGCPGGDSKQRPLGGRSDRFVRRPREDAAITPTLPRRSRARASAVTAHAG